MSRAADDILERMRALPPRERLRLIERAVHEIAEETAESDSRDDDDAIWADVEQREFDDFEAALRASRSEPWRALG